MVCRFFVVFKMGVLLGVSVLVVYIRMCVWRLSFNCFVFGCDVCVWFVFFVFCVWVYCLLFQQFLCLGVLFFVCGWFVLFGVVVWLFSVKNKYPYLFTGEKPFFCLLVCALQFARCFVCVFVCCLLVRSLLVSLFVCVCVGLSSFVCHLSIVNMCVVCGLFVVYCSLVVCQLFVVCMFVVYLFVHLCVAVLCVCAFVVCLSVCSFVVCMS